MTELKLQFASGAHLKEPSSGSVRNWRLPSFYSIPSLVSQLVTEDCEDAPVSRDRTVWHLKAFLILPLIRMLRLFGGSWGHKEQQDRNQVSHASTLASEGS